MGSDKDAPTVAVVGAGPSGLSMLKTLREDGFNATLFERRDKVGGLWAYSQNPAYTTALPITRANLSKFTCGFSDYPIPDKYPIYMSDADFQEFMDGYATHFGLHEHIVLNAAVAGVERDDAARKWRIAIRYTGSDEPETREFDKVVLCTGYQTEAKMPELEGRDKFGGIIMHSQEYRSPEPFKDKNVLVMGLSSTTGDIVPDIAPYAAAIHVSHRRGALPFRCVHNGTPLDLTSNWHRRQMAQVMQRYCPELARVAADLGLRYLTWRQWGALDKKWKLQPAPSATLSLPGTWAGIMPLLRSGRVDSAVGVRRILGPREVELSDGQVLADIDAIICCTGYRADWKPVPFVETSTPSAHGYAGVPIRRLWMNMFPPAYADSCAILSYSAFGKSNGFSFADVTSMAVSNMWRGVSPVAFPPRAAMEAKIDSHHEWLASRWAQDHNTDVSAVRQWEFQGFLHAAAGTGCREKLSTWGLEGWKTWWNDREMYNMMRNGPETAHMYRYFDSPIRKRWEGAADEIRRQNTIIKDMFPLNKKDEAEVLAIFGFTGEDCVRA